MSIVDDIINSNDINNIDDEQFNDLYEEFLLKIKKLIVKKLENSIDKKELHFNKEFCRNVSNITVHDIKLTPVWSEIYGMEVVVNYTAEGSNNSYTRTINNQESLGIVCCLGKNRTNPKFGRLESVVKWSNLLPHYIMKYCEKKGYTNNSFVSLATSAIPLGSSNYISYIVHEKAEFAANQYFERLNMNYHDYSTRVNDFWFKSTELEAGQVEGFEFEFEVKHGNNKERIFGFVFINTYNQNQDEVVFANELLDYIPVPLSDNYKKISNLTVTMTILQPIISVIGTILFFILLRQFIKLWFIFDIVLWLCAIVTAIISRTRRDKSFGLGLWFFFTTPISLFKILEIMMLINNVNF